MKRKRKKVKPHFRVPPPPKVHRVRTKYYRPAAKRRAPESGDA